MTGTPHPERAAVYELTVSGPIGPVVRSALWPHSAAPSQSCTILLAETARSDAVPELMLLLDRCGLDVEGVFDNTGAVRRGCRLQVIRAG